MRRHAPPAVVAAVAAVLAAGCLPPSTAKDAGHIVEHALTRAHSHNDETRDHPLDDALAARFGSIEVDVVMYEGELVVGHDIFTLTGGLDVVYLDYLQQRVDERGSVYGDGAPFLLWIDLKVGDQALRDAVFDQLERYDMLTRFTADTVDEHPVTVILTGDEASKAAFIDEHPARRACRDSNFLRDDDPQQDTGFRYYAIEYDAAVDLQDLVARAHAKGRPLRIWGAPDTIDVWQAEDEAGVDLIGTDDIGGLAAYFAE